MMKPIEGYPKYYINEEGQVWSNYSNRFLTPQISDKGYYRIGLIKDGKQVKESLHRLIAKAFIPNPDNLPCINHKDHNRLNNNIDNLEWCSYEYNNHYDGRILLTGRPVRCVETNKIYPTQRDAAKDIGLKSSSSINMVCRGERKTTGGYHWEYA